MNPEIKVGTVLYIRTTEEPVFILKIRDDGIIDVRRPVQTRDGIRHLDDSFTPDELTTKEELRNAQYKELKERESLIYGANAAKPTVTN